MKYISTEKAKRKMISDCLSYLWSLGITKHDWNEDHKASLSSWSTGQIDKTYLYKGFIQPYNANIAKLGQGYQHYMLTEADIRERALAIQNKKALSGKEEGLLSSLKLEKDKVLPAVETLFFDHTYRKENTKETQYGTFSLER